MSKDNSVKKNISGSTLKIIAMVTMLIDHIAASVLYKVIVSNPDNFDASGEVRRTALVWVYLIMRCVGRLAFPIFIFLLIEGFVYTRSRWKYLFRLTIFAFISEIPFDMAFRLEKSDVMGGKLVEFTYQNVFFTLAIGMLTIILIDKINGIEKINPFGRVIFQFCIAAFGMTLAYALRMDYGEVGVLAIVVAYLVKNNKRLRIAGACAALLLSDTTEAFAIIDIIPVSFYKGRRGLNVKWIFYAFYPLHLLVLGIITMMIQL